MALTLGTLAPKARTMVSGTVTQKEVYYTYDMAVNWESDMPAIGSASGSLYVVGYSGDQVTPPYREVVVRYSSEQGYTNWFIPDDDSTVYKAQSQPTQEPIETHPNFKMKWAYDLYRARASALALPAWASTAVDASDTEDSALWVWEKTLPGPQWKLAQKRSKPGTDFYLLPRRVVVAEYYNRDKPTAEGQLADDGYLRLPGETFGLGGTASNWLVAGVDLRHDGRYWVAVSRYLHSDFTWDSDIYTT